MDVLVFTPVYRLEPETVLGLMRLEWDRPLSILLQLDNPNGGGREDHSHQYQRGRELFLSGPYEAMLVLESDILPPADTLKRLAELQADVAYGCYVFRSGTPVVNILEKYPQKARNMGESLTVRGLWQEAKDKGVIECSGAGLGCILIKRKVLEKIPFELVGAGHCDWNWTEDVYRAGFSMMADTGVICGHKDVGREDSEGEVLWPA